MVDQSSSHIDLELSKQQKPQQKELPEINVKRREQIVMQEEDQAVEVFDNSAVDGGKDNE